MQSLRQNIGEWVCEQTHEEKAFKCNALCREASNGASIFLLLIIIIIA